MMLVLKTLFALAISSIGWYWIQIPNFWLFLYVCCELGLLLRYCAVIRHYLDILRKEVHTVHLGLLRARLPIMA